MSTEIECSRCEGTKPAIAARIPFRDPLRQEVQASICADCWQEWLDMQVKVINELALNLGDPRSHQIIEAHAREFFGFGQEGDEPAVTDLSSIGDVPPRSDNGNADAD